MSRHNYNNIIIENNFIIIIYMSNSNSRQTASLHKHHERSHTQNLLQNEKLDSQITQATATNTKLDQFSGAINNSSIGDATVKLQTYIYGHDSTAGQARALKVDSTGRLECNVADIELHTGDISLSVDGLEGLITTTNTKLQSDLDFAGQPNSIGDGQNMKRVMNYGHDSSGGQQRPLKVNGSGELSVAVTSSSLPTGGATEATLSATEVHAGNIQTAVELLDDVVTAQSASHPSKAYAVGGRYYVDNTFRDIRVDDIGKVIIDSPAGSDINTRLDNIVSNTSSISDAEVHLSAIDTNIVNAEAHLGLIDSNMGQAELHLSALDTNISNRLPTTIGPKDESLSLTIARNNTTGAFDTFARTNITDRATSKALLCNSDGELNVINATNKSNSSEVGYVSGQSISGSGTFTGSAIALSPNTHAIFVEHNFSHTGIKYELMASIDGANFFGTGLEFNAGGLAPATLTGIETILGTSGAVVAFPPHIKFKFSNSDSSAQTATLSYVIQSS
jgi:hypothetical protein